MLPSNMLLEADSEHLNFFLDETRRLLTHKVQQFCRNLRVDLTILWNKSACGLCGIRTIVKLRYTYMVTESS